jgi:hypothetical protein
MDKIPDRIHKMLKTYKNTTVFPRAIGGPLSERASGHKMQRSRKERLWHVNIPIVSARFPSYPDTASMLRFLGLPDRSIFDEKMVR